MIVTCGAIREAMVVTFSLSHERGVSEVSAEEGASEASSLE